MSAPCSASVGRCRGFPARIAALALAFVLLGACARTAPPPVGPPVADPGTLATALQVSTRPPSPRQVNFAWTLNEGGSEVKGKGVVRFSAPDRLRLDLFGARGETYLAAALVEGEYRVPAAIGAGFDLPSPTLLWAALGIVVPPPAAELESGSQSDAEASVRYRLSPTEALELRATLAPAADSLRLTRAERIGASGVLESVYIDYSSAGSIQRARYRDWSAYRELVLEPESVKDVSSFPESIWRPDGAPR